MTHPIQFQVDATRSPGGLPVVRRYVNTETTGLHITVKNGVTLVWIDGVGEPIIVADGHGLDVSVTRIT